MMEHDNGRKKECIHVCVTGFPCCTVEKKCIGEITILKNCYYNSKKKKRKLFLEMDSTVDDVAVKTVEMTTKDLEYFI